MKTNRIINQEHIEAEQEEINKKREEFMKSLSSEELAKFSAVDKAVNILVDAKVMFYLFPQLPKSIKGVGKRDAIWQWNSLGVLSEYDLAGKLTEQTVEANIEFHDGFFYSLYSMFGPERERNWDEFVELVRAACSRFYKKTFGSLE